ncbi:MAG: nSTAND1 domain-containing NTPase, partial [Gammaproteobacteria bacterium]
DEHKQKNFSELLCRLVNQSESACRILLTLRTDHLARFETSPSLRGLYHLVSSNQNTKQLAAMDFANIHQAIEIPAKKIGLRFLPPTIIDALASQTASLVDGLPLLQFSLQRLWEDRPLIPLGIDEKGNEIQGPPHPLPRLDFINEESFKKLPDVQSALGKVAEDLFRLFDKEKQKLCERLMLELVLLDENFEQPLRRRRSKEELFEILLQRWPQKAVNEVINVFVKQGLLRYCGEAQQLEVAHEAMFRNWPTFREWISGEEAKTRLHAVKLIGREALDWRRHENSQDYLKLSGEPLKSAQDYVKDCWLVDKDSTDYINACYEQERKIVEQAKQAKQAEKLAQKAEVAQIQAKIAEANAKAQKKNTWFALAGLAFVIIAAVVGFGFYNYGQKKAALISLPLVTSKLPLWKALDVANTMAIKDKDFRYVLAHTLESMEDRYLFPPREKSNVVISGQGTAIFQYYNSKLKEQNLKVFRICEDGSIDNNFAEILFKERQLTAQYADIAPPNFQPGGTDNRLLILPFQRKTPQRGWDIEVYRLNWQNEPCADGSESKNDLKKPEVKPLLLEENSLNLDNVYEISALAFDASGKKVAFSAISYPKSVETAEAPKPESTVWEFDRDWKPVPIDSTKLNKEQLDQNENVVSAVAFTKGGTGLATGDQLVTGRLNGALYCNNIRLEKNTDESPVRQILTNHSKFGAKGDNWFVYRHESGKVIARRCESTMQEEMSFNQGNKEIISFVSIDYIPAGVDKKIKPVVTYVNGRQPSCWIKEQDWKPFNCSSAQLVGQFAIAPDAKHLVTTEPAGESNKFVVHKFSQEFSDVRKLWAGRLSGKHLLVWPKDFANDSADDTSKISKAISKGITRFEIQPSHEVEILKAAISPAENYIAWLEQKTKSSKIDLRIFNIKADKYIELLDLLDLRNDNINTFNLAVTDNGLSVLAINEKLKFFKISDEVLKEIPLPNDQVETRESVNPNISCLELSPSNNKLVIGTQGGALFLFNLTESSVRKTQQPFSFSIISSVNACAVDDSGAIVGGFADGNVLVVKADNGFQLSPLEVYKFKEPVTAVSIDSQKNYVAALSDWQTNECISNKLPGQFIRIWTDLENKEKSSLISNTCFPNRRVLSIGSIMEQNNELLLPVAFDEGVELKPCRGCAKKNEKRADVL